FGFLHAHPLALGVVGSLISSNQTQVEVVRLGVSEIETADRSRRCHGVALRQGQPLSLRLQQGEQLALLRVLRTRWVAESGTDPAVAFLEQGLLVEPFRLVAPFVAHALMEVLCKS